MSHAETFRRLHAGPDLLLLANCWDAGTARLVIDAGARALATSSAAVAWSHGYPDGEAIPLDRVLATVRAIARIATVPLSVDLEAGYATDPAAVAEHVLAVVDAGAVGINLEDGRDAPEVLAAKIAAIRAAVARRGADVFVNARTDVYLKALVPEAARVDEAIARGRRYADAGADGVFVPAVTDPGEIRALARAIPRPLNVLARASLPPAPELAALGVRRLSAGSALASSAWAHTSALARTFLADGRSAPLYDGGTPGTTINALFTASTT
jgi:2-methylisocitrate lyase-like PEP mutase family enzyme